MSKNVKIIISILIVFIVIVVAFILIQNNKNVMSKDDMIQLLYKGESYANVILERSTNDPDREAEKSKYKIYKKDNISLTELNDGKMLIYYNGDTNEYIGIDLVNKSITYDNKNNISNLLDEIKVLQLLSDNTNTYKCLGETKVDNRAVITFRLTGNGTKTIYKVDKETGIVVQRIEEGTKINNSKEDYVITWKIQPDKVTEENVTKPDISKYDGYTIYNNREK